MKQPAPRPTRSSPRSPAAVARVHTLARRAPSHRPEAQPHLLQILLALAIALAAILLSAPRLASGSVDATPAPAATNARASSAPAQTSAPIAPDFTATPNTLDDLADIQTHATRTVAAVMPATVGIEVGPSQGSGVIVTPQGHILTAAHVTAQPGQPVLITFPDGSTARGRTLGHYHTHDAAMVRITDDPPKGGWPYAPMAPTDAAPKVGQWLLALGHPGGYIRDRLPVVRLGRVVTLRPTFLGAFIWTDCTLTAGDSGGPLFDLHGRVVGVHSRIGKAAGANYHVPVAIYRTHWDRFEKGDGWRDGLLNALFGGAITGSHADADAEADVDADANSAGDVGDDSATDAASAGRWLLSNDALRSGERVRRAFVPVIEQVQPSVVEVRCNGRPVALGAVVSDDGLVMTKLSEMFGRVTCVGAGNQQWRAQIVAEDRTLDLALLRMEGDALPDQPVTWAPAPQDEASRHSAGERVNIDRQREVDQRQPGVIDRRSLSRSRRAVSADVAQPIILPGMWVITPSLATEPVAVGVAGVARLHIPPTPGMIGIRLGEEIAGGVAVAEVFHGSGAEAAGLAVGDVVTHVEQKPTPSRSALVQAVRKHRPGDRLQLRVRRADNPTNFTVRLTPRLAGMSMSRSDMMGRMGAELSHRADDFPAVIQHDAPLVPATCGGPLVDLRGRVLGLNIARADRTASYALPADLVREALNRMIASLDR